MLMNYKKLVLEFRNKMILTQTELAEILGVSYVSINKWGNGKYNPTTKVKRKIVALCKENNIELES